MTESNSKKFLVLYLVPSSVMEDWAKTDPRSGNPPSRKCKPLGDNG